jgi:hypothetical protein
MLHPNLRPNFLGFEDEFLVLENFGAIFFTGRTLWSEVFSSVPDSLPLAKSSVLPESFINNKFQRKGGRITRAQKPSGKQEKL